MTAEASGGHEDLLDYEKERTSHELLTMPTAGEAASNGYIRRRPGPAVQAASNGFVVVDGQSREDADDGPTYDLDEVCALDSSSFANNVAVAKIFQHNKKIMQCFKLNNTYGVLHGANKFA